MEADQLLVDDRRARFTARIPGRGGVVELAIDPSQLHLFDSESGAALKFRSPTVKAA
jgi:hypothetical protein